MNKRLTWTELTLNLKNPFTVSYGSSTTRTAYWIRLDNDEGMREKERSLSITELILRR
jgi:L-alanine-DL-glutamate epimerase-like enolase superfamily enzyme